MPKKFLKKKVSLSSILLACWLSGIASVFYVENSIAAPVIIVNPSNSSQLSKKDIKDIFLGKKSHFPDGHKVRPLILKDAQSLNKRFFRQYLHKTPAQFRAFWAIKSFTGKGLMPKSVSVNKVVELVSENLQFIGYIDEQMVNQSIRVVPVK